MKNKKLLYVLIPGVIVVWGAIIYKIVAGMGGGEEVVQKTEFLTPKTTVVLNDTFSIHPTYRDPFSGKQVKKVDVSTTGQQLPKKTIAPPILTQWPEIVYGGIVKNQKSNKQLVLVLINGQSTIMKVGESFNSVELTKVFKDSVEVKFGKEKKFVKK